MSRCRACNNEMEVQFFRPKGCDHTVLEDLCPKCKRAAKVGQYDMDDMDDVLILTQTLRKHREEDESC